MKYIFWIIVILVVVAIVNKKTPEQEVAKYNETIKLVESTKAEKIAPNGELAKIFSTMSEYTDIQRENKTKELTGKVVEWTLPVYDVQKKSDVSYIVQTIGIDYVDTVIYLTVTDPAKKAQLEALKTNDMIKVKGLIKDTFMRKIIIDPARIL